MSATTVVTPDLTELSDLLALTLMDRCDECGAQAFTRFVDSTSREYQGNGDLLFCGHHANKYTPALVAQGFECVVNDIAKINAKPSASSGTAADDA